MSPCSKLKKNMEAKMAKKPEGQNDINFLNMSPDVEEKVRRATEAVVEYMVLQRGGAESIKETLIALCNDLGANKESEKRLKKAVKTCAGAIVKSSAKTIQADNEATERLLERLGELS